MAGVRAAGSSPGVVAVGASAGGVEALAAFVGGLAPDTPYPVLVVLHVPASAPSVLARILDRSGPLDAVSATDGDPLEPNRVHVAVPDRHLLVDDHRIQLAEGPTENGYRPAINALFRSVALSFGPRAIGVILSGVLDDGVQGAAAIRTRGGTVIAQRPDDALYPTMPQSALDAGAVDHQAAATDIGALLTKLADRAIEEPHMEPDHTMELENRIAMGTRFAVPVDGATLGPPSGYTCPDCNGSLMELDSRRYRCRVGHAWTADALLDARDDEAEGALWIAVRSLQEKAHLSRRLADAVGPGPLHDRYLRNAREADRALEVLGRRLARPLEDDRVDSG